MLEISPQCGLANYLLGYVHLMQGRSIQALADFEQERFASSGFWGSRSYITPGQRDAVERGTTELVERESVVGACQIAWGIRVPRRCGPAFEWLERGYASRDILMGVTAPAPS